MSTHKHIDKICLVAAILSLILCAVFMNGETLGIQAASKVMGYESRLFDTSQVHTIDIIIDDWDAFLDTAQSEEYSICSVVIDGEAISNVGIRGKGNTSLSTVSSMDSDRYSFKIEFDQYDSAKTYHGLDKLSLNNIIQDNTYMKDYLTYQMMGEFGVAAPLCSYAYITVNGEDWGLYLAVEAVEESFLQRNYGSNYGNLYKPDSMDMGGGRDNGRDFEMPEFMDGQENSGANSTDKTEHKQIQGGRGNKGNMMQPGSSDNPDRANGETNANEAPSAGTIPGGFGGFNMDEEMTRTAFEELGLDTAILDGVDFNNVTKEDIQIVLADLEEETVWKIMQFVMGSGNMQMMDMGEFGAFNVMGSSDVKLQYIDDDPDSYSAIFDSAKTDITDTDKNRLINSLKQLSEYENLEEVVNTDAVLRYFVVHNYVVNGDSYTGSMIHNYYLYEEDGQLAIIPWDYNLAFGTFQGGNASSSVNDDIDVILSDRPMQAWIFSDETYSEQYYALYAELLEQIDIQGIIDHAYELIAPYVEKDPTAFCTYSEFQTGVETLKEFCILRSESVLLQLSDSTETVDVGTLDISDMGTMNMGGDRGDFGGFSHFDVMSFDNRGSSDNADCANASRDVKTNSPQPGSSNISVPEDTQMPDKMQVPDGMEMLEGMQMPERMELPDGIQRPSGTDSSDSFGNFSLTDEMPDFGNMGSFDGIVNSNQNSSAPQSTVILLAVSVLFLAAGLIVAFKFKR